MTKPKTYRPDSGSMSLRKVSVVRKPESGATILLQNQIVCSLCVESKPSSEFYNRCGGSKKTSRCKICTKRINKEWRKKNKDAYNRNKRAWRKANRVESHHSTQIKLRSILKFKKCSKCIEVKPLSEFPKHKKCYGGRTSRCKKCTNISRRDNYRVRVNMGLKVKYWGIEKRKKWYENYISRKEIRHKINEQSKKRQLIQSQKLSPIYVKRQLKKMGIINPDKETIELKQSQMLLGRKIKQLTLNQNETIRCNVS